ncbi:uncharacterized protein L201_004441 [Kwoniella dendrophila CBS 6074]|uniref:Uncharacterized protein n=1 Tax=Kwoniella dendrophila CBS 6074 TaxID=1295534 RepID=A0AAX4JXU3_9TREE
MVFGVSYSYGRKTISSPLPSTYYPKQPASRYPPSSVQSVITKDYKSGNALKKGSGKKTRKYVKRDQTPKINERESSLYLPKTETETADTLDFQVQFQVQDQNRIESATVDLPIYHTYTSSYTTLLPSTHSLISDTYHSTETHQHSSGYSTAIEEDSDSIITATRPFSTCLTYSSNSLGLDFFPSPPEHTFDFPHPSEQSEDDEDKLFAYIHFSDNFSESEEQDDEKYISSSRFLSETTDTTYVSTPTTSYDLNHQKNTIILDIDSELDIDKWKSRRRTISFSVHSPILGHYAEKDSYTHTYHHTTGNGTGKYHHHQYQEQQAYINNNTNKHTKRHSFYDTDKNYSNWAKEKFYASEIDLTKQSASTYTLPVSPLNLESKSDRSQQTKQTKRKHLTKRFNNILDKMTIVLESKKKDSLVDDVEYNDTDDMAAPPPIPARSRLRSVPSVKVLNTTTVFDETSAPSLPSGPSNVNGITQRKSSLFRLPVDQPLDQSSPSTPTTISPVKSSHSPTSAVESPSANDTSFSFGKRKSSKVIERDPLKVKDGVQAKGSSSGVYTPSTFPGAQNPRPSHFPSHVYTPTNFSLYPQASPISPSSSSTHSFSSSHSDSTAPPITPLSPTSRISKAVSSNMRRFSSGIVSLKDKTYSNSDSKHQRAITTPMLESGEYLSTSGSFESDHSRDSGSSWTSWQGQGQPKLPSTMFKHSDSGYFPPINSNGAGLGVGLDRDENRGRSNTVIIEAAMDPINFAAPKSLGPGSGSLAGKGKRKPVPRLLGSDEASVPIHAM